VLVSGILISRVTEGYENNYKLQEMKSQIESLSQENKELQLKISELKVPERIISIAQTKLDMVPSEQQIHMSEMPKPKETASN
jgi:cell division protein FtsL